MDLARLIIDSRRYLYEFDYDHYPVNFEAFGRCAGPFFDELEEINWKNANRLFDLGL